MTDPFRSNPAHASSAAAGGVPRAPRLATARRREGSTRLRLAWRMLAGSLVAALCVPPGTGATRLGAALLFRFDKVTVVYPAGPGEDREANRLSAESRAAFLTQAQGVETLVRADDEVGDEELRGHLLLLGWNNRLLGTERVMRPFERTDEGLRFLGIIDREPGADLLLSHFSPYNDQKLLVFWSRIDPEIDRFMVLPMLGSDWGIYHDFLPVRQGMFVAEDRSWPPRRQRDAEKDHAPELNLAFGKRKSRSGPHYTLSYHPDEISTAETTAILAARERAFENAAASLGLDPGDLKIQLYVYPDQETKIRLTGVTDLVHSVPRSRELYMIKRYALSAARHEEVHLIARQALGRSYVTALYEGLAVAHAETFRGRSLDLHAAVMLEKDQLPALTAILDNEGFRGMPSDIGFPSAGLLVRWIEQTMGKRALGRAYGLKRGSLDSLAAALERPAASLDSSFRAWLDQLVRPQQAEVGFLRAVARGRDRDVVGDYEGVAAAMREALAIKPDEPQALFSLAAAEMRLGDYEGAERHLQRIIDLVGTSSSLLVTFAHFELGRLYDIQGRREEALAQYRKVLERPDLNDAHLLAREAIATPLTVESLQ